MSADDSHNTEIQKIPEEILNMQTQKVSELEEIHTTLLTTLRAELAAEKEAKANLEAIIESGPTKDELETLKTELEVLRDGQSAEVAEVKQDLDNALQVKVELEGKTTELAANLEALTIELATTKDQLEDTKKKRDSDLKSLEQSYTAQSESQKQEKHLLTRIREQTEAYESATAESEQRHIAELKMVEDKLADALAAKGVAETRLRETAIHTKTTIKAHKEQESEVKQLKDKLSKAEEEKKKAVEKLKTAEKAAADEKTGIRKEHESEVKQLKDKLSKAEEKKKKAVERLKTAEKTATDHEELESKISHLEIASREVVCELFLRSGHFVFTVGAGDSMSTVEGKILLYRDADHKKTFLHAHYWQCNTVLGRHNPSTTFDLRNSVQLKLLARSLLETPQKLIFLQATLGDIVVN
jgi:chromosome segregation ATPase